MPGLFGPDYPNSRWAERSARRIVPGPTKSESPVQHILRKLEDPQLDTKGKKVWFLWACAASVLSALCALGVLFVIIAVYVSSSRRAVGMAPAGWLPLEVGAPIAVVTIVWFAMSHDVNYLAPDPGYRLLIEGILFAAYAAAIGIMSKAVVDHSDWKNYDYTPKEAAIAGFMGALAVLRTVLIAKAAVEFKGSREEGHQGTGEASQV
ncbi:hypothetical protein GQ53DRAFT_826188 [Thozetella sp. PMI_491]|nr:hypothetical protein GQ53DRAFT_826188 [Thozetella sp. PMI_491]